MQKDSKIGMALGLVLVGAAALWLATRPCLSTKERMLRSQSSIPWQKTPALSNNPSTNELTADSTGNTENNQSSTINHQSSPSFHIVREGETLSAISFRYYGSANNWRKILDANRNIVKDVNKLRPGAKLIIPE